MNIRLEIKGSTLISVTPYESTLSRSELVNKYLKEDIEVREVTFSSIDNIPVGNLLLAIDSKSGKLIMTELTSDKDLVKFLDKLGDMYYLDEVSSFKDIIDEANLLPEFSSEIISKIKKSLELVGLEFKYVKYNG